MRSGQRADLHIPAPDLENRGQGVKWREQGKEADPIFTAQTERGELQNGPGGRDGLGEFTREKGVFPIGMCPGPSESSS